MRLFIRFTALAAFCAIHLAAETKGIQAVLLQCWSSTSVNNMLATVKASTVTEFEISSSPYLDDRCQVAASHRFDNLNTVINALRAAHKNVRVTIFLGRLHATSGSSALETQMGEVWSKVIAGRTGDAGVSFNIGTALEDNYPKESVFLSALLSVGNSIPAAASALGTRFSFRRSIAPPGVDGLTPNYRVRMGSTFNIHHEIHGLSPRANYGIWSNDGAFVTPGNEICTECTGTIPLETFRNTPSGGTKLLWRPAYNLHELDGNPVCRPPAGVSYVDCNNKFGTAEQAVLRRFLQ